MSSANKDHVTSSFLIWMPFISFSCLIAKPSNTVLYESGESGHSCLVPDLRGKAYSFALLSVMLAVGLSYGLYYVEIHSLFAQFVKSFCHESKLNYFFFCIY